MLIWNKRFIAVLSSYCLILTSCTLLTRDKLVIEIEQQVLPLYKIGEPYQVNGTWYSPREDDKYRRTGMASWCGVDQHGKETANGEIFNMATLTAAHKTLPMPSIIRVTNLDNGRSLIVRINDRGPFTGNRIIDLSQRAAQLLGFELQGTTQTYLEILPMESLALKEQLLHYPAGNASASNITVLGLAQQNLILMKNNPKYMYLNYHILGSYFIEN